MSASRLLLRDCEVGGRPGQEVLIEAGRVRSISALSSGPPGRRPVEVDAEIDGRGGALLPGLHDHHLHLFAEAARRSSVWCGPPEVVDHESLTGVLRRAGGPLPVGAWLRGVGYDSRLAGPLDRARLDAAVRDRPVRVKDRTGLAWTLNSAALRSTGLEDRAPEGVLAGDDRLLQEVVPAGRPELGQVGESLAGLGVTGVTDTTPGNTEADLKWMRAMTQRVRALAGPDEPEVEGVTLRTLKVVLREDHADVEDLAATVAKAHAAGWSAAVHAVTRAETLAAAAAFAQAGCVPGDRVEHASVLPGELVPLLSSLGLTVVTHPAFVARRGDVYLADVDPEDRGCLYRLRSLLESGVPLAAGSDAPVGGLDPWEAMAAAVSRTAPDGSVVGPDEALSPEEALGLFLGTPERPGGPRRSVSPGALADLCLLAEPWSEARRHLSAGLVRATVVAGDLAWAA